MTGGAGTGKSHLVRCIQAEVERTLLPASENPDSPVVLQVAYTGTAAYNTNGQTIHSAFTINKGKSHYLGEDAANTLRARLQDLQLLIIDEISMVSTNLLQTIHCRLEQIKQCKSSNKYFGNISVLAVGDSYQTPPVKGKQLCNQRNSLTDIWSIFHLWELHQVVRQQEDLTFANMLNRFRVREKSQTLDPSDVNLLKTRLISPEDPDYPKYALHIYPTRAQLATHNDMMLEEVSHKQSLTTITAADISLDRKTQKSFKRKEPLIAESCLPEELTLCPGARVMLTCNLDAQDGLTKGAIGTVTSIISSGGTLGLPGAICVLFDDVNIGRKRRQSCPPPPNVDPNSTIIKPHTDIIQHKPFQVTRHQFPLKLAWGMSIHKVQGMTTKRLVASIHKVFKPGMAYVALSRVTSLSSLYIIKEDFSEDSIYCNPKVAAYLAEMPLATSLEAWKELQIPDLQTFIEPLLIVSHNTEGLLPHLRDFSENEFLRETSIICLQETWLTPAHTLSNLLPDYEHICVCR